MTFSFSIKKISFIFCIISLLYPITSHALEMDVVQGVPQGFEQLNEPRATQVTVYYGGDLLGPFKAHFTPGNVQFDEPNEVLKAIPNLKPSDEIKQVLQSPMPSHAELLCSRKRVTDCNSLSPESIGVIFNESQLTVEIFINKKFLSLSSNDSERYLPLPKKQLSSIYSFNGAVNGTDTNAPNFSLTNEAIHSFGEMKLNTQSTVANQGLRFDTIAGSIDRQGVNKTAGLFRSRASQLIPDRDMAGVSVSTSRRTILDSRKTDGSNVIVYLPRRSFVSIYRDGRLYSSHAYEAGNQQLDTSELPEGAYTITLRIQEADGSTRDEKRFFVKAQEIPPSGKPTYYAQAGVMRKPAESDSTVPQVTSDPILQLGTIRRISDNAGVNANILGVKDRAMLETGTFMMMDQSRINASVLGSTAGDMGVQASYQKMMRRFNIAFDTRKIWMGKTPLESMDMWGDLLQGTAVANYMASDAVTLGLRGSYTKQDAQPTTTSFGPYAEWRIWQKQENMLSMNVNAARTEGVNEGSILFSFTRSFGKFGMNNSVGMGVGGNSRGPFGNTHVWHDNQNPDNNVIIGGGLTADETHQIASSDVDWRNNVGQLRGNVQEAVGKDSSFGYGGNFSINAAQTKDDFQLGGRHNDKSAVIIDTKGDNQNKMTILVNDTPQGTVTVGKKQIIYLNPYHSYRIRLEPVNAELLDFDNSNQKITVYPGNVVKLSWNINKFYVVAAHIITADQKPLANAILQESKTQLTTNDKGYLQAELSTTQDLHFTTEDKKSCVVEMLKDIQAVNNIFIYKQPLICREVSGANQ